MSELERMTARHCAATLLGEKTGSMFLVRWERYPRLRGAIGALKRTLSRRGVVLRVLGTPCGALVYAYRPDQLERDLGEAQAREILERIGYGADVLSGLQNRLLASPQFPHEIGLFLGYPARDVAGFIEHGGANCLASGLWKVYHDVERAECLFCAYRQCRERMKTLLDSGMTLGEILGAA
jgi:hypothetical protein